MGLGNKEIMAMNIQYYMDLHHKSRNDMCSALGVKYTTFTDWVTGKVYPRIDKIELMANYFGIQKSDLVEERVTSKAEPHLQRQLLSLLSQLNEEGQRRVLNYVEDLVAGGRYELSADNLNLPQSV